MKRSLLFLFILFSIDGSAQSGERQKRNTFGYVFSTGAVTCWTYDNLSINEEFSKAPSRFNYSPPTYGIFYNCRINYLVSLHLAVFSSKEHFSFSAVTNQRGNLAIDYKVAYLRMPVGLKFYLSHFGDDIRPLGGFFVQLSGSIDYISQEDIRTTTSPFEDPRFLPPGYIAPPPTEYETHSSKFRFNRISPTLALGHEIVGNRMSFFYGGEYEFPSAYQERNTQEYFRNWKFTFFEIGFGYRF